MLARKSPSFVNPKPSTQGSLQGSIPMIDNRR